MEVDSYGKLSVAKISHAESKRSRMGVPESPTVSSHDGRVTLGENVYVMVNSWGDPEVIRRALTRMISGYSVAWLFDDAGAPVHPVIAVVTIFDGDGFALIARSRTSTRTFLPDIHIPLLH